MMNEKEEKPCKCESSSKEYIKYSGQGNERQAARAMYEYFNNARYIKQLQAST